MESKTYPKYSCSPKGTNWAVWRNHFNEVNRTCISDKIAVFPTEEEAIEVTNKLNQDNDNRD